MKIISLDEFKKLYPDPELSGEYVSPVDFNQSVQCHNPHLDLIKMLLYSIIDDLRWIIKTTDNDFMKNQATQIIGYVEAMQSMTRHNP